MRARVVAVVAMCGLGAGCLAVPVAADRPELTQFAAPRPGVPVAMEVVPLRTGHASAPRCAMAGAQSCLAFSEIVHVAYLVKHPRGTFLIDATLSARGPEEVKRFSWNEQLALGFTRESSLAEELKKAGSPKIEFVLLTHGHWDHTSGLRELDHPRVVMGRGERRFVERFPKDRPPVVMPDHVEGAQLEEVAFDGPAYEEVPRQHDWFGDGSVVLVPLPGHTPGSMGVFLNGVAGRRLLFIGDAGWSLAAVEGPSHKLGPLSDLTDWNRPFLAETLWRLHHLHQRDPSVLIVPAHDGAALEAVRALGAAPSRSAAR